MGVPEIGNPVEVNEEYGVSKETLPLLLIKKKFLFGK